MTAEAQPAAHPSPPAQAESPERGEKPPQKPMEHAGATFAVSPAAVDAIARQMRKRGTPEASLRVGIRGGGCSGFSYVIEFHDGPPRARDRLFAFQAGDGSDVRVLVDPKSLVYLNGTVLAWEQTLMRQGFKFENPNEKSGCGCGSSFSV